MSFDKTCFCCILKNLKEKFGREQLALSENRTIDWSFAKNALSYLKNDNKLNRVWLLYHEPGPDYGTYMNFRCSMKEFYKIVEFMIKSFDILNLRETILPADLMRTAYIYSRNYEMAFHLTLCELNFVYHEAYDELWCICERQGCKTAELTEATFQQLLKMPYNIPFPVKEDTPEEIHKHVVWCAMREGHEQLLSGFLKYGVMFLPAPNYELDKVRYREALVQLLRLRKNYQPPEGFRWPKVKCNFEREQERRAYTILRVMELLTLEMDLQKEHRRILDDRPEWARPYLAKVTDDILNYKSAYFRCLRRAYETIPEPFVSSNEVRKILRHAYDRIWNEELEFCVNEIVAEFEKFYPEAAGPTTPRSLKHLSRCQVRENLRQSSNLPHGIKDLGLEDLGLAALQKYVALEE